MGFDLTTGAIVNEVLGASISDVNTEPHIILVPQVPGQYQIQSIGTSVGDYKVFAIGINKNDVQPKLMGYVTGTITISNIVDFSFDIPSWVWVYLPVIFK